MLGASDTSILTSNFYSLCVLAFFADTVNQLGGQCWMQLYKVNDSIHRYVGHFLAAALSAKLV